jgi:hypothetical protein
MSLVGNIIWLVCGGNLGVTRDGETLGHRYAVALGLALA